jgi:hypothetical protein
MASFSRILTDSTGLGLLYEKSPTHATANHDMNDMVYTTLQPRFSFQYYVNFNLNEQAAQVLERIGLSKYQVEDIQPLVKSISMPSFDIDTEILDQYDRPVVSQTKIKREPVKIVMYDTVNGATLKLWQAYYEYYFKDGREGDLINPNESSQYGYNIRTVGNEKYFFDSIEIAMVHGSHQNSVILFNPRIVSFEHEVMTYEKSQLVELTYTLEYEYAIYNTNYEKITSDNLLRYAKGEFLDLPGLALSLVITKELGKYNPLLNSSNPILRKVGGYAQDIIRSTTSNATGSTISKAGTSVLGALGDIGPKASLSNIVSIANPQNFLPRI